MTPGSLNLRITTGFVGKMQQHSNVRFKLNNEMLETMLQAISGKKFHSEIYAGTEWQLTSLLEKPILVPGESLTFENLDGTLSIRFSNYQHRALKQNSDDDLESTQSEI